MKSYTYGDIGCRKRAAIELIALLSKNKEITAIALQHAIETAPALTNAEELNSVIRTAVLIIKVQTESKDVDVSPEFESKLYQHFEDIWKMCYESAAGVVI